jgi:hypothetical protein
VIVNARVRTGDPRRPWADAIAIEEDRIHSVASSAEVMKLGTGALVIDARGAMISPDGIRAGMPADLEVLDGDAKALLRIVGGKVVFEKT